MKSRSSSGFTLVELIAVILVIGILMALLLGAVRGMQESAKYRLAQTQIAAIESALERYKADHGTYPMGAAGETDSDPRSAVAPSGDGSLFLYKELSGDTNASFSRETADERQNQVYMDLETMKALVKRKTNGTPGSAGYVEGLADPWGNFYGYSTLQAKLIQNGEANPSGGYNPTYDMWSTATKPSEPAKWADNW